MQYPNIMNEYQANQLIKLNTTSNMTPLEFRSSENINSMRNILQCPLCIFTALNRSEFAEHLINHCTLKSNNSSFKAILTSLLNQDAGDNFRSPFTLTKYIQHETEKTGESSVHVSCVNSQSNVSFRQDGKGFREAKNCKQCNFIASTKIEYWQHMRCHIKGFTCSECSFVTKYKHHMNHHLLSVHDGSKPFKCKKCSYRCVSKSMLTSHLKKHSNIYPYRCADCTYKTKFCNALKKHLRKKEHQPAMVLNADGSPNPLSFIDIYGTKRGPKQKPSTKNQEVSIVETSPPLSSFNSSIARYLTVTAINGVNNGNWLNHNDINKNQSIATFPYSDLIAAFNLSNHVLLREDETFANHENVQKIDRAAQFSTLTEYAKILNTEDDVIPQIFALSPVSHFDVINKHCSESHNSDSVKAASNESSTFVTVKTLQLERQMTESADMPLDLCMTDVQIRKNQFQFQALANMNSSKISGTSKRKGKAIKLERRLIKENTEKKLEKNEDISFKSSSDNRSDFRQVSQKVKDTKNEAVPNLFDIKLTCHYCEIIFGNAIMYTVHMGCHSFDNPYTCNICGYQCTDRLSFFMHIARSEH
ncbi:PREDICTED: protein hunchback-like [Wasmannia auropunctata]|uniref:protein hunchback-like n=1 Tax=Wasmannia auropunctata TaxID=64793 RepID=UPI0005EE0610|nr:PREDICTED: protein hunchback-like [Wasmannia auropunctata]XP_011687968.1 PREDICTED: protein hunchback-like [Wasmannia auropunctata]XP_011687978.1 PREDICTED: protein hunchback-like [Wasmannia auropunctata]